MTFREAILFFIGETTRFIGPVEVATEWVLAIIAALVILNLPGHPGRRVNPVRDRLRRLAAQKRTAIIVCGVLPIVIRLSMLGFIPVPDPSIHDEFSHLLLADTLAHGRLTNPTHPMWVHFETIHVIQRPTYNSMYPPGQASFLALGQLLFHEPWAGVVISVGLSFAAMCWMMQAWLPPTWALCGTLIAILKFGLTGLWINSYLSGAVSGIGGALLLGSLPRLRRRNPRLSDSILLGLGIVILMNTRPLEGAVLTVAGSMYLLIPFIRRQRPRMARLLVPAGVIVSLGVLFTGYYCWRVTGSPVRLPYQVNRDTYGWPENLAVLPPKKVTIQHPVLRDMYALEIHNRDRYATPLTFLDSLDLRLFENWTFFIGPILTIPLLFLPFVFRDRRTRPLLFFVAVIATLNLFQLVLYPYHLGPIVCVLFAIVVQAIRHMYVSLSRVSRPRALYISILLPICLMLVGALKQEAAELGIPLAYWETATENHRDRRAYIQSWLTARPGKHLVIVRYAPGHSVNQEWVYNQADIDGSKVVWARGMDRVSDATLLNYFSDREPWLLEADVYPQRVVRFPGPPAITDDTLEESTPCPTVTFRQ